LGAAAFVALTVSLGQWQSQRAAYKEELARSFELRTAAAVVRIAGGAVVPEELQFRRIRVQGEYDAARTLFVDNRLHQGSVGYQVLTPFRIAGTDRYVLVDRGWTKAAPRRDQLPAVATPAGTQTVEGIGVLPPQRVFELAPDVATGPVRQHVKPGTLAAEWQIALHPVVIQQTDRIDDGLVRDKERPDTGADKHRAYALQWYTFAALTVILYVILGFRRTAAGKA
jgi:surfeit locus 1 family protein